MQKEVFKILNMKCSGCSDTVSNTLKSLTGVESVDIDLESKDVQVSIDPSKVTKSDMATVLEKKGYPIS